MEEWIVVGQRGYLTDSPEGLYWTPLRDHAHPFSMNAVVVLSGVLDEPAFAETKEMVNGSYVQMPLKKGK